jgi:hypothetical protein
MALPISFWELQSPHQVVFYNPLPEGTEVPNNEGVWAMPRMVRHTRFPVGPYLVPIKAREAILEVAKLSPNHYLLIAWLWNTYGETARNFYRLGKIPKIAAAMFRCPTSEIQQYGKTIPPDWFRAIDEVEHKAKPTAWDRLVGDDKL